MNTEKEMQSPNTKQRVFSLFILVLFLPILQLVLPTIKEKPLDGIDPAPKLPEFTIATWFNEEYQKNYVPTFEQNIGFHNSFVRLHNQINYSVFGFSDVGDVVVGKGGYLFLKPYINAYTGKDFVGSEYISLQVQKIKLIQTELKKKNIDFFIVFAPGKGSFYSEYIPDNFKVNAKPDSTNYAVYKKMYSEYGVNNLDLKSYFFSIKNSEKYPLYSTTGVHWTEYGCYLAGKEMVKYIEALRKITLPKIKLQSIEIVSLTGNKSNDYDAACLMNVFSTLPHPKYAIPKLQFESNAATRKPRFLCITDSYFPGIVNTKIPSNVFTDYHYWLYNTGIFPEYYLKAKKVESINFKKEIEKQDVICILSTDATLGQFPFGFVDKAYELYAKKDKAYYSLKKKEFRLFILKTMENINNNKDWKAQLVESAKKNGVSETVEFLNNANWLYGQKQLEFKNE